MNLLPLGLAKAGASRPPLAVLDRNLIVFYPKLLSAVPTQATTWTGTHRN